MKKMFLLTFLAVILMLRIATGVRITEIFQKEVYRMSFNLVDGKVKDLKINNKYPWKYIWKLDYKEDGKYKGYFLVKSIKEYKDIYFIELEDIKSEKIENNFLENYLQVLFNRAEEGYLYETKKSE